MTLPMLLGSSSTLCKAFVDRAVVCVHTALVSLHRHLQGAKGMATLGRSSLTHLSMLNMKALNTFDFC